MEKIKYWSQYTNIQQFEDLREEDLLLAAAKRILVASAFVVFLAGSTLIGLSF